MSQPTRRQYGVYCNTNRSRFAMDQIPLNSDLIVMKAGFSESTLLIDDKVDLDSKNLKNIKVKSVIDSNKKKRD